MCGMYTSTRSNRLITTNDMSKRAKNVGATVLNIMSISNNSYDGNF